jgi:putative transposase
MWAIKTVQQHYTPGCEMLGMLDEFRQMMNACIHVGLVENVTSLKVLSLKAYKQLAIYDAMSYYKLCAISSATGIYEIIAGPSDMERSKQSLMFGVCG